MSLFFFSTAFIYCGYNLKVADYDCHMQELNARLADLEAGMLISSQTQLTAVVFFILFLRLLNLLCSSITNTN